MMEKLEHCPVCGGDLDQLEYDTQSHGDHWNAIARAESKLETLRKEICALREATEAEYQPDPSACRCDACADRRANDFMRGRAYEAKRLRRTIGEIIRTL